jgi:hypothetical protein
MSHPLSRPLAKVKRARQDFADLNRLIADFRRRDPYGLVTYSDLETREFVYAVRASAEPPEDIGIAIGVVSHSLRSAFDWLAGVLKYTGPGPAVAKHEFPVYWDAERYETEGRRKVQGASRDAWRLIDDLQPFRNGVRFDDDPLYLIHHLDLEKHNDVILVGAGGFADALKMGNLPGQRVGFIDHFEYRGNALMCPLVDGAEFLRWSPNNTMQIDAQFSFHVAFAQSGIGKGHAVLPALHALIEFTEQTIGSFQFLFPR